MDWDGSKLCPGCQRAIFDVEGVWHGFEFGAVVHAHGDNSPSLFVVFILPPGHTGSVWPTAEGQEGTPSFAKAAATREVWHRLNLLAASRRAW